MRLPFVSRREHERVISLADRAIQGACARTREIDTRLSEAVQIGINLADPDLPLAERQAARERLKELWL